MFLYIVVCRTVGSKSALIARPKLFTSPWGTLKMVYQRTPTYEYCVLCRENVVFLTISSKVLFLDRRVMWQNVRNEFAQRFNAVFDMALDRNRTTVCEILIDNLRLEETVLDEILNSNKGSKTGHSMLFRDVFTVNRREKRVLLRVFQLWSECLKLARVA